MSSNQDENVILDNATASIVESTEPVTSVPVSPVLKPTDLRVKTEQVNRVIDTIKEILDGRTPSPAMVLRIVANCMQLTSSMKLDTTVSKRLLTHSFETFLRDPASGLSEDEVQVMLTASDLAINEGFDVLNDVHKRVINLSSGKTKSCCSIL
jgi:hypothetical protein